MNLILKGRQHGFTSLIAAIYLYDCITKSGINCAIIGHDNEAMKRILDNVKVMLYSIPNEFRPIVKYDNRGELMFPGLNSRMFITTYRTESIRSGTLHRALCTEVGFWEGDVQKAMSGISGAIPEDGIITIESTPNGIGDFFYEEVQKAKDSNSAYKLFIYPWFVNKEYIIPESKWHLLNDSIKYDGTLDVKEKSLVEQFELSLEQLTWRRHKMFSLGDMRIDERGARTSRMFAMEFECNFMQSGMSVFDSSYLFPSVHFLTLPRKNAKYVHGADTCEGVEGGDYAVLYTIDLDTGSVVCKERGIWKPGDFADKIHAHCMKWGGLLAVERNGTGHAVIEALISLYNSSSEDVDKMPYWMYYDTDGRLGWNTREANRYIMFSEGEEALSNGDIKLAFEDSNGLEELLACHYDKRMKPKAPNKMHDDSVMALLICWQMRKYYHEYDKKTRTVEARVTVF